AVVPGPPSPFPRIPADNGRNSHPSRPRAAFMDQRYSTIIFVPHARAKFRKLKVSHRLLISLVSFVTSSLCLSTFFSVQYFTSLSQTHELTKLRSENKDLQSANEQFTKSEIGRASCRERGYG